MLQDLKPSLVDALLKSTINVLALTLLCIPLGVSAQTPESRKWTKGKERAECKFGVGFRITHDDATKLAIAHFNPICAAKESDIKKYPIKVTRDKCEFNVVIEEPENCIHGGALYTIDGRTGEIVDFFAR